MGTDIALVLLTAGLVFTAWQYAKLLIQWINQKETIMMLLEELERGNNGLQR